MSVGLYLIKRSLNLSTLAGSLDRSVEDRRGTRGRWSVSSVSDVPSMYSENFSHAHVAAKASFSMTAYRFSVSLGEREAYETGHLFPCASSWSSTAPRPSWLASAATVHGTFES